MEERQPPVSGTSAALRAAYQRAIRPTRRNLLHWTSWGIALGIELLLVRLLWDGRVYAWEQSLTRRLQAVSGTEVVFDLSSTITNTLSLPFLLIFVAIVAGVLLAGYRGAAALLFLSFPLHVLAQFPKALVDRPRPSAAFEGIEGIGGSQSFPSGHAEYVITFYGFLAYLLVLHVDGRWARTVIVAAWLVLVLATGFGRVALGRHWPLDVLAAYIVGIGLLSGLIWLHAAMVHAPDEQIPRTELRKTSNDVIK
jgi:undecaprenyl-diphosphatase